MSIIVQILLGLTLVLNGPSTSASASAGLRVQPPIVAPLDTIQPHP